MACTMAPLSFLKCACDPTWSKCACVVSRIRMSSSLKPSALIDFSITGAVLGMPPSIRMCPCGVWMRKAARFVVPTK